MSPPARTGTPIGAFASSDASAARAPPAPRSHGDQLCPATRGAPGDRGEQGTVTTAEQRADRAFADVEHPGDGQRREPRDPVESRARHRAAAHLTEVDAARRRDAIGERIEPAP